MHSAWDMDFVGDPMGKVLSKVSNCQVQLTSWNKKTFGNVLWSLAKKRKQLAEAESISMARGSHERVRVLTEEINKLMDMEECMWNQRLKTKWLQYGDQNTKYFHCQAMERNKRNFISGLENEFGEWVEEEEQVGEHLIRYYSNLFASSNPTQFNQVLNGVEPRVSSSMNEDLLQPFDASKVQIALKEMDSNTAPGPDGLPPMFCKKFWSKVGHDI